MFSFHSFTLLSSNSEQPLDTKQTKLKSVRFSKMVSGKSIPNRKTLKEENLITNLWFQPEDYLAIKKEALREIRHYILDREMHGEIITPREAANRLFQPHAQDSSEEYPSDINNRYDALKIGA